MRSGTGGAGPIDRSTRGAPALGTVSGIGTTAAVRGTGDTSPAARSPARRQGMEASGPCYNGADSIGRREREMAGDDPFDLERFVAAQAPVFDAVRGELQAGRKRTHWMWFVFPQIEGLGHSPMALRYAIGSLAEAEAYVRHDVLGPRLRQCTGLVNRIESRSALAIFGRPDDVKFRSCMTLFSRVSRQEEIFLAALARYFDGAADPATLARLT